MDIDEKTLRILNAMQGITYKEWMKISNIVDMHFKNRANQQLNEIVIASPDSLCLGIGYVYSHMQNNQHILNYCCNLSVPESILQVLGCQQLFQCL